MTQKSDEIFALYNDVKLLSRRAQDLELSNVKEVLAYVSDLLVKEHHQHALGVIDEVNALEWDEEAWPGATAILLEMKTMILKMEEKKQAAAK